MMHYFLIFLFFAVAKCAPSGLDFGPSTVAPFSHSNSEGYYGGSQYNAGLSTVATFTGNTHGNGPCTGPYGCGRSTIAPPNYAHGNGYNGDSNGYNAGGNVYNGGVNSYSGGVNSYSGGVNGFNAGVTGFNGGVNGYSGGSHHSAILGASNGGLASSNSGHYANTDGFAGGLSNGHLTAGAINGGAHGSFTGGVVDGHLNAVPGGSFQTNFNNGFGGHLTAGGNIASGGSGSLVNSINAVGGALGLASSSGGLSVPTGPQGPIVTKDFYFHTAAENNDDEIYSKTVNLGPARKHYRVVFIKAPSQSAKSAALQILQAQNEEKTVIYVLSKKTDAGEIHTEIQGQQSRPTKPEVFFIKYKTPEEAIHAQRQIQAQYDSLGGVSRFSDEGIKPVTSIIGSLGHGSTTGGAFGQGGFIGSGGADLSLPHSNEPTGPGGFAHPLAAETSGSNIHGGHGQSIGTDLFSANNHAEFESSLGSIGNGGHGGHGGPNASGHFAASHQASISSSLGASNSLQGVISTTDGYLPPKH